MGVPTTDEPVAFTDVELTNSNQTTPQAQTQAQVAAVEPRQPRQIPQDSQQQSRPAEQTQQQQQQKKRQPENDLKEPEWITKMAEEGQPMGKVLQNICWASIKCVYGMEYVGEIVANVLGVTQSRYQYVLDFKDEQDEQAAAEDLEHIKRNGVLLLKEMSQEGANPGDTTHVPQPDLEAAMAH